MPRRLVCPCRLAWGISTGKAHSRTFSTQSIGVSSPSVLIPLNQSRANLGGFRAIAAFLTSELNLVHLGWPAGELLAPFLCLLTGALLSVPSQAVQEMINQVLEKLEENQVPMPDYALKSSGAVTLSKPTSSKALPLQLDKAGV